MTRFWSRVVSVNRIRIFFWVLLYVAFHVAARVICMQLQKSGAPELCGWDYQTFVGQIQDWHWIGYFGFRHPGLGLVMSPLVVLEHLWSDAYLFVMPAIATATAGLIYQLSGRWGLLVWLSFPTTWLMAGIPESFPVAQLALVASVWYFERKPLGASSAQPMFRAALPVLGWMLLNSAITLTNGIKPVVVYLVMCRDWEKVARIVGAGVALMALGLVFFGVRSLMTGRGVGDGIAATLSWIPSERNLLRELYGFFIRPIGLVQSCVIYPLVIYTIIREIGSRRMSSLSLLASYFVVDVIVHCVIGWGMREPWVFAPHWIWILPLLVGRILNGRKSHLVQTVK